MEIHFLQVKFYSIGVYFESEVVNHLQQWKGKSPKELEDSDDFFASLISGKLLIPIIYYFIHFKYKP